MCICHLSGNINETDKEQSTDKGMLGTYFFCGQRFFVMVTAMAGSMPTLTRWNSDFEKHNYSIKLFCNDN